MLLPRRISLWRPPSSRHLDQPARAKPGWCWEGNPHTWLGMASARDRRL
ncbi:DUF5701 family protein [Lentzea fradiae]